MRPLRLILLSCALQAATDSELRLHPNPTQRLHLGPPRASETLRAQALATTARVVNKTNAEHAAGRKSYFMSQNELSDLTNAQYRAFLTSKPDRESPHRMQFKHQAITAHVRRGKHVTMDLKEARGFTDVETMTVPKELDWTKKDGGKYMTPIKNQGTCGSCWAFAGVAVVESRIAIEKNVAAAPLSVEQVLSCSGELDHLQSQFQDNMTSSSEGCWGGMPFLTYAYLQRNRPHGIACESDYPYAMATNETSSLCLSEATNVAVAWVANVSGYNVVASNEHALLQAVMTGPVTANIDAGGDGFRLYGGGIYDAQDCLQDGDEVNHAVVVVGFGETESGAKYWILRNTWGTMWGEDGYMRIARGGRLGLYGPCNLYLYADYPVNLTVGPSATTCAAPPLTFAPLSTLQLIELSSNQVVMLVLCSVLSVCAGLAVYHGSEFVLHRKQAAGELRYEDAYARWILPSRDQLAAVLNRRSSRR